MGHRAPNNEGSRLFKIMIHLMLQFMTLVNGNSVYLALKYKIYNGNVINLCLKLIEIGLIKTQHTRKATLIRIKYN